MRTYCVLNVMPEPGWAAEGGGQARLPSKEVRKFAVSHKCCGGMNDSEMRNIQTPQKARARERKMGLLSLRCRSIKQ